MRAHFLVPLNESVCRKCGHLELDPVIIDLILP